MEQTFLEEILLILFTMYILLCSGNSIAKRLLSKREIQCTTTFKNGSTIGNLERIMVFIGIVIQEWTLIGIVVALKTIARYNALNDQDKSEYFLIGSLFSLLWAISIGTVFMFLISHIEYFNELKFLIADKTFNIKIVP